MATPRFAWGIDIGNRALKAVRLVSTADGLVIDDFDVVEHETILSASGDNRDQLVQTALATFVGRHPGIEKGQVGVSVNGQRTFAKFIKLPPVETKKIPEIVRFEAIQQIPFPLDDVEWAYHLFQDPESPDVEVGIFAMRKELVNAHIQYFTDAKLNVQVVQMSPLSVYNAMYYDSRIKGTTMIVDIGAESTDLIIAEGEGVWLRSIPIGGNNFTESLTKPFKVDFDKAEELKRTSRTSRYSRQIVQNMRPIFADLVSEIQRSMGFYTGTHKESRIERVVALGNTFRLPGLQRYLQQNLTLDVKELDRLGTSTIEDPNQAALLNENLLSAVGAYGLALQVMGQGKIASSLLPERIRTAKMWREKNKIFAAAAALFVVGTGVAYGSYYVYNAGFTDPAAVAARDQISAVEHQATTLSGDWDKVEQAGGGDLQRVKNVELLTHDRGMWQQINTVLQSALPQFAPGVDPAFAAGDPAALKKVPRGDRKQVVITACTSKYYADLAGPLSPAVSLSSFVDPSVDLLPTTLGGAETPIDTAGAAGLPGGAAPAASGGAAAPAGRGFVLTLRCVTPNQGGAATLVKYISDLQAIPPTADRPIKVVQASVITRTPLGRDPRRMAEMAAAYASKQKQKATGRTADDAGDAAARPNGPPGMPATGGGEGMPGAMPAGMPGAMPGAMGGGGGNQDDAGQMPGAGTAGKEGTVPDEAYQDPVLKEDVRGDTEAVIVVVVQLDAPLPPAPATPGKSVASAQ